MPWHRLSYGAGVDGITRWAPLFELGAATRVGLTHDVNEDAVEVRQGLRDGRSYIAMVVCDGVTNSSRGDLASSVAAAAAIEVLVSEIDRVGPLDADERRSILRAAVHRAHAAVCDSPIEQLADTPPPGTTLVAALVYDGRVDAAWVGDSRAYLLSPSTAEAPGELCVQLTHDHSWVNLVVDRGDMSQADAAEAPLAHAITRCIGPLEDPDPSSPAEVSHSHAVVTTGSRLVLCTDGIWGYADTPAAFAELVGDVASTVTAVDLAAELVAGALRQGGGDDMTAAVAFVEGYP